MIKSSILGFILGCIIMLLIKKQLYHGPDSNEIRKKIYFDNNTNTFFQFIPKKYVKYM